MAAVIEAQALSKRFFLGERNRRAFFEDVSAKVSQRLRSLLHRKSGKEGSDSPRYFWALKDVSFEVPHGQTLAIIGENGAGKSTLLKILSRITKPTTGTVKVYGRIASLLEVGTGFHPEFSGRDNIYLNGTMLGLSRKEISRRFDQIVDFSGVGKFIDVPVKNYSSGMYVRLAFSVAAHLNPEIMILDEVLAVGDAVFQKKCFDRMEEIMNEGHAAILVSHGMANVSRLSQSCLWLRQGRVEMFGPTHQVVSEYEKRMAHTVASESAPSETEPQAKLLSWSAEASSAVDAHTVAASQEKITFRFDISLKKSLDQGSVSISLADFQGMTLLTEKEHFGQASSGPFFVALELGSLPIKPSEYILTCTISEGEHPIAFLRATPELTILPEIGTGNSSYHGLLNLPTRWSIGAREEAPALHH
jgi:lipopolysaccharide transport system ATP-binding protein